jgi:RNA polymerase sigma-70 factor (ECF subfamily)
MSNESEQDLLRAARAFDAQALAAIYNRYHQGLFAYAMRLLGDEALAEDCVAETFSRFLRALRAGQGPQEYLQAYLYRVAHNWATDTYRRMPPPPFELDEALRADDADGPDQQASRHMEQERVRGALRMLTPDQRQVVVLRFLEGWGNEEVAAALEKPVSAVKALQHRALGALRRWLLQEEDVERREPYAK